MKSDVSSIWNELVRRTRKKALVLVAVCIALAISVVAAFFGLAVFAAAQQRVLIDRIVLDGTSCAKGVSWMN